MHLLNKKMYIYIYIDGHRSSRKMKATTEEKKKQRDKWFEKTKTGRWIETVDRFGNGRKQADGSIDTGDRLKKRRKEGKGSFVLFPVVFERLN